MFAKPTVCVRVCVVFIGLSKHISRRLSSCRVNPALTS